jgi:hypothetical protein
MSGSNTTTTLNGLFKEVYADKIENLIPDGVKLLKLVPYIESAKEIGNLYHQPVQLSHEHGITYAAADSGAFNLNLAVAAVFKDAQLNGAQMLIRSSMSYEAAARASNDKKAFVKATSLMVQNMVNSIAKRLELSMFYGRTNIGQILSSSGSGGTRTYTLTAASWSNGAWAGSENMPLDVTNLATPTSTGNKVNTNAQINVVSVSLNLYQVTVSGNSTDLTAVDAQIAGGAFFIPFGSLLNDVFGLDRIITNTGVLYNIDASLYNLWAGNVYDAQSAALSFQKILSAVAEAVEKGLDQDVVCMLSPKTWANISSDQAALRMYDDSYKTSKLENGASEYSFAGQNGKIDIVSSIYVKEGECFIFPPKRLKRIGAMNISFKMPGRQQQEDFFLELTSQAGYELRAYTDQTLFSDSPARLVKIVNIVNS